MTWGFKESFMRYLKGPIAKGTVTTTGRINESANTLNFSQGEGTYNFTTHGVEIAYRGSMSFYGNNGALDMTFSNVRLITEYENRTISAYFVADISFKEFLGTDVTDAPVQHHTNVKFAEIDASNMGRNPISFDQAVVTLTAAGAQAMGGFYEAGEKLDNLTLTSEMGGMGSACPQEPEQPADPEAPEQPGEPNEPAQPTEPEQSDQPEKPKDPTPAQPTTPGPQPNKPNPTPSPSVPTSTGTQRNQAGISAGTFTWGLKDSFVKYINGPIAKGKITVSGGTEKNGVLTFKKAQGSFDPKTKKGHVSFSGNVNYKGHGGLLDSTLSNFTLKLNGGNTATLAADVSAKNLDGRVYSGKQVSFASVKVSGIKVGKNSMSLADAPTKLTQAEPRPSAASTRQARL